MPEHLRLDGHALFREAITPAHLWMRTATGAYRRRDGRFGIRCLRVFDPQTGHKVNRWRLFVRSGGSWAVIGVFPTLADAKESAACAEADRG